MGPTRLCDHSESGSWSWDPSPDPIGCLEGGEGRRFCHDAEEHMTHWKLPPVNVLPTNDLDGEVNAGLDDWLTAGGAAGWPEEVLVCFPPQKKTQAATGIVSGLVKSCLVCVDEAWHILKIFSSPCWQKKLSTTGEISWTLLGFGWQCYCMVEVRKLGGKEEVNPCGTCHKWN